MADQKLLERLRKNGCSPRDLELAKVSEIVLLALRAHQTVQQKKCG